MVYIQRSRSRVGTVRRGKSKSHKVSLFCDCERNFSFLLIHVRIRTYTYIHSKFSNENAFKKKMTHFPFSICFVFLSHSYFMSCLVLSANVHIIIPRVI